MADVSAQRCIDRRGLDVTMGRMEQRMPLARYFLWVGSVLLALLFIADACLPQLVVTGKTNALAPVVRIHSEQKWPERVVYDTSVSMPKAAPATNPETSSSPPLKLREAFAELRTIDAKLPANPKQPEAILQRQRKLAKKRAPRPALLAVRRSPFGWFGPTIW